MKKFDSYFENKGIRTKFNTLGDTEELIRSFVKETQDLVDNYPSKRSHHIKKSLYDNLYEMSPRTKLTGFELVNPQDVAFRNKINDFITTAQFSPLLLIEPRENKSAPAGYKDLLINHLKSIDNPVLYLSGGLDSELLASALVESGVRFKTVIFEWLNKKGEVVNSKDLDFAYNFCHKHGIYPVIKQLDIETLWESNEFASLAIDMQILSTQLVTYAYTVTLVENMFPDSTHLFAGEIRYYSDYLMDDGSLANIVYLGKLVPGYNGVTYTTQTGNSVAGALELRLFYSSTAGTWSVTISTTASLGGTPTSGSYTDTASSSYEYRISSRTINQSTGFSTYTPTATVPTSYATVTSSTKTCSVTATDLGGVTGVMDVTFGLDLRVVGQTTPVQSSTIRLKSTLVVV